MTQQDKTLRKFIKKAELFSHMNYSGKARGPVYDEHRWQQQSSNGFTHLDIWGIDKKKIAEQLLNNFLNRALIIPERFWSNLKTH